MKGLVVAMLFIFFAVSSTKESRWTEPSQLAAKFGSIPLNRYYNQGFLQEHFAREIFNSLVAFKRAGKIICNGVLVSLTKVLTTTECALMFSDMFWTVAVVLGVGHEVNGLTIRSIINVLHQPHGIELTLLTINQPAPLSSFISVCPLPTHDLEDCQSALSIRLKEDSTAMMNFVLSIWATQKNIYVSSSEYPDIYNSTMDSINTNFLGGLLMQERQLVGMLTRINVESVDQIIPGRINRGWLN